MANRQTRIDFKRNYGRADEFGTGVLETDPRRDRDPAPRRQRSHHRENEFIGGSRALSEALYTASNAGVKIELLVRGICCLRPGVKNTSENIKVISVVDRFLEHSRIYYFRADGAKKIFLSSADWMPRNLYARNELAFPIKDPILKKYLRDVVLATSLADNERAWLLKSDGTYARVEHGPNAKKIRSQFLFEEMAKNRYKGTILAGRP